MATNSRLQQLPPAAGHDIVLIRLNLQRSAPELKWALNGVKVSQFDPSTCRVPIGSSCVYSAAIFLYLCFGTFSCLP